MSLRTPPPSATGTYNLVVTNTPGGSAAFNLMRLDVNVLTDTDYWMMIFAGTEVPANGTVPLMPAIAMQGAFENSFVFAPQGMPVLAPGLVAVLSTTSDTLTAAVAASANITAFVEEYEFQIRGTSYVGDLTTEVLVREVWAEAADPRPALYKVEVHDITGVDTYLLLFAKDSPSEGDIPIRSWRVPADGYLTLNFGTSGYSPLVQDLDGTIRQGCTFVMSFSATSYVSSDDPSATIRATIK